DEQVPWDAIDAAQRLGLLNVLRLVQVVGSMDAGTLPRLWLVTSGSQEVGDTPSSIAVAQAPTWGLSRTISNELPGLRSTTIYLSPRPTPDEIDSLCDELLADDDERELALRRQSRFAHRLVRTSLAKLQTATQPAATTPERDAFTIEIGTPGILDTITPRWT